MELASKALELVSKAKQVSQARVPLHLKWSLPVLLGVGVGCVWLFLGKNEQTTDSFQKKSQQQTKELAFPQDQLDGSGSMQGLLQVDTWSAAQKSISSCPTAARATTQACSSSRVHCDTHRQVHRRVFSPPALTGCFYKLGEASRGLINSPHLLWGHVSLEGNSWSSSWGFDHKSEAGTSLTQASLTSATRWRKLDLFFRLNEREALGWCVWGQLAQVCQDKKVHPCLWFPVLTLLRKLCSN